MVKKLKLLLWNRKDLNNPHIIDYKKKVSEYKEYLVEYVPYKWYWYFSPWSNGRSLKWAKARTDEWPKIMNWVMIQLLKASDYSIKMETENIS